MTLIGTTADEAKAPCEQMYFPKLQRIDGTLTLSRFDRLSGLGTTFGVLTQAGALRYEHLALANTFEFPLIETTGNITVTDCPIFAIGPAAGTHRRRIARNYGVSGHRNIILPESGAFRRRR